MIRVEEIISITGLAIKRPRFSPSYATDKLSNLMFVT